jgi:hypothetical protein
VLRAGYLPELAAAARAAPAANAASSALARCEALLAHTARGGPKDELAAEPIGRRLPDEYAVIEDDGQDDRR